MLVVIPLLSQDIMGKGRKKKPLIQNIRLEGAAAEGKAFGKWDEKIVFVKYGAPGDVVDIQITKNRSKYAEGKITEIHEKSSMRVDAFCEHFALCGGCKWQHIPYQEQLNIKEQQVKDNLTRLGGGLDLPEFEPILGSEKTQYYRNKMEFTFSAKKWLTEEEIKSEEEFERRGLGFHIPGAFDKVLDLNHCYLQSELSEKIRKEVRRYALEKDLIFFDLRNQEGLMRTLMICTASTGDIMVLLAFFEESDENLKLLEHIGNHFPEITSLLYTINDKKNDTLDGLDIHTFKGNGFIMEEMEGLKFKINPKSFYQTNSEQAYELYSVVRDFADLKGNEVVYDLYSGTGTIGLFLSKQASKIIGVEYVEDAVTMAKENAETNGVDHTAFFAGDMKDILNDEFISTHGKADVVITDPPRAGMHDDVINTLLRLEAPKIVYVSCNPATQARDLSLLSEKYSIERVKPVDMFPQTHHVENVVLLKLKDN